MKKVFVHVAMAWVFCLSFKILPAPLQAATPEKIQQAGCFDMVPLIGEYPRKSIETVAKTIELILIAHARKNLLKYNAGDDQRRILFDEREPFFPLRKRVRLIASQLDERNLPIAQNRIVEKTLECLVRDLLDFGIDVGGRLTHLRQKIR